MPPNGTRAAPRPPGPTDQPLRTTRRFSRDPLALLSSLEASYGDVAAFRYGPGTLYLVTDPGAVGTVLGETGGRFAKLDASGDDVEELLGSGLLLSEGEQWKRHRSLMEPWFARGHVESAVDVMVARTREVVDEWTPGDRVDVYREASALTLSVFAEAALGVSLSRETIERLRVALEPVGARFEPDPIRSALPEWLPTPGDRAFREGVGTLESVVDEVIAERRATTDDEERLLDALLAAYDDGSFTRAELRDELVTLLLAGHDTTALTLTYAWYLLAGHPSVDERLGGEVADLDGPLDPSDLDALDVTGRVVSESLRLYPPAWLLLRRPTRPVTLAGYGLPADAPLLLSPWALHRSERWYESPTSFDPSRWRPGRGRDRPAFAYVPFGAGPRTCVGRQFALVEARVVLAEVARRVRFVDPPESLRLRPTLTLHPDGPVELTVEARDGGG